MEAFVVLLVGEYGYDIRVCKSINAAHQSAGVLMFSTTDRLSQKTAEKVDKLIEEKEYEKAMEAYNRAFEEEHSGDGIHEIIIRECTVLS